MGDNVWNELETAVRQIYSLPHNALYFQKSGSSPEQEINRKLQEIRSGLAGLPKKEEFLGPKLFFRVAGYRVFSGEWWFDASTLENLERDYSRLFFNDQEMKTALRAMLRELLAISTEWNAMEEVWVLELPPGEKLTGFSGIGSPQKLFGNLPLTAQGNRMLTGRARQIFFPVKNPLWVKKFRNLV